MNLHIFPTLPSSTQELFIEMEKLDREYEVELPATQNPKLVAKGVKHKVRLWSVPRETGELLHATVLAHHPRVIVELGTSAGYSTVWLALAAAQYGGRVITIDSSPEKHELAKGFIRRAGLEHVVDVITMPIADALARWDETIGANVQADALFFDADKKNYERFYTLALPHLTPTHTLLADDAVKYAAAMQSFIDRIQHNAEYESALVEVGHGVLIARTIH